MWIFLIIVLLILLLCFLLKGRGAHRSWGELAKYRYAHRGLYNNPSVPENSLAAFRLAVENGYGAELDIHLLRDGRLAVIHDSDLKRMANADVIIENLSSEDLADYRLCEGEERIPLVEEVLELFKDRTPLIIELKSYKNNAAELSRTAYEILKNYNGLYCIESFDPMVVSWFFRNAPGVIRGQLSCDFMRSKQKLTKFVRFALTHLLVNFIGNPDFVAYKWEDRKKTPCLKLTKILWGTHEVSWTLRDPKAIEEAEKLGNVVIFEK